MITDDIRQNEGIVMFGMIIFVIMIILTIGAMVVHPLGKILGVSILISELILKYYSKNRDSLFGTSIVFIRIINLLLVTLSMMIIKGSFFISGILLILASVIYLLSVLNHCIKREGKRNKERKGARWLFKAAIIVFICLIISLYVKKVVNPYKQQPMLGAEDKVRLKNNLNIKNDATEYAKIIEDNDEALLDRILMIQGAEQEIILSTFDFRSDEAGKIIMGALLEAADRGVHVRIIVDGISGLLRMKWNPYFGAMNSDDGIDIKIYNPVDLTSPDKLMASLHDKYVIVDGRVYVLGGRNTFGYFLGDYVEHKNIDRDVLVKCNGETKNSSVKQLLSYFEEIWSYSESKEYEKGYYNWFDLREKYYSDALKKSYDDYVELQKKTYGEYRYDDNLVLVDSIQLLTNPIDVAVKKPELWYQLTYLMRAGKKQIKVHTPYIILDQVMYDDIVSIVNDTDNVSIMTNSVVNNGNIFGAADYYYRKEWLLESGVSVYEYDGGISYHGKSILIDDNISIIGSFNFDMRSAYIDTELMLYIKSIEINDVLRKTMENYEEDAVQYKTVDNVVEETNDNEIKNKINFWKEAVIEIMEPFFRRYRFLF